MKKICALLAFLGATTAAVQAQYANYHLSETNAFLTDGNGRPLSLRTAYNVEGVYTFPAKSCPARVKVLRGKEYGKIPARIDLTTQTLIFESPSGEQESTVPIQEVVFDSCDAGFSKAVFRTGFPPVDNNNGQTFYQVLAEGKYTLLKQLVSKYSDQKPYNSATVTRVYEIREAYYLYDGSSMQKLEKKGSSLAEVLPALANEINQFTKKEKLNLKKETGLVALVSHLNGLNK